MIMLLLRYDTFLAPVYADVIFVIDHSEDQVNGGELGNQIIDYVIPQKAQIISIITQLGVKIGGLGHRFILAHFSDDLDNNPWTDPLSGNMLRNKTGILFDPTDNYNMTEMFRRINLFNETLLMGSTNLGL
jgi:hypothetical protein